MSKHSSLNTLTCVYVACADDACINCYHLDTKTQTLIYQEAIKTGDNVMPLAISPDKQYLYAFIRSAPNRVIRFKIEWSTGKLSRPAETNLPASMPYITTDKQGEYFLGASYDASKVFVSSISQGVVSDKPTVYPTDLNAHCIVVHPSNQFVYATSLGGDKIYQYCFNSKNGKLTAIDKGYFNTPKGVGPRHIVITPDGQWLYVVTEMQASILCYKINHSSGALTYLGENTEFPTKKYGLVKSKVREQVTPDEVPTAIWAADIKISPNGQFLYMTERTSSSIASFKINKLTGQLDYIENIQIEKQPRSIAIDADGQYLVTTGQRDNHIGLYRICPQTGRLEPVAQALTGKNANWVEVVTL